MQKNKMHNKTTEFCVTKVRHGKPPNIAYIFTVIYLFSDILKSKFVLF